MTTTDKLVAAPSSKTSEAPGVFFYAPRKSQPALAQSIPILTYHQFVADSAPVRTRGPLCITQAQFARQMALEVYNAGARDGLEEDRLQKIRDWLAQVDALVSAATPPPPPSPRCRASSSSSLSMTMTPAPFPSLAGADVGMWGRTADGLRVASRPVLLAPLLIRGYAS